MSAAVAVPDPDGELQRVVRLAQQIKHSAPEAAPLVDIIVENYLDTLLSLLDDYASCPLDYGHGA